MSPVREQDQTPASYIIWGRKSSEQCSVGNHFDAFCEVWRGKTGAVRGKHKLIVFVKLNIHRATALFKFLSVKLFQSSRDDPWRLERRKVELAWFLKTEKFWQGRRTSVFLDPDHEDEDEDALSAAGVALVQPGRLHQAAAWRH